MADTVKKEKAAAADEVAASARLVKYMGSAHVRRIDKGDTFGGQLPDGVESTVEWDLDNHHVTDVSGWSDEAIELLLAEGEDSEDGPEFVDVTNAKRVAPSLAQRMFRGARPHARLALDADLPKQDTDLGQTVRTRPRGTGATPSGASTEGGVSTPDPARGTGTAGT